MNNDYYTKLALLESSNNPYAKNPKSSAKGKYQFIDSTAKAYGITAPFGTPEYAAQEDAAIKAFTADNHRILSNGLGREPTQGELYLAHQQGAGTALKLLKSQDAATDIAGNDAIVNNAGNAGMTGQEFAKQWTGKFDGGEVSAPLGRRINLPDGRTISLSGAETPEQLKAIKDKIRAKYPELEQPQQKVEQAPAEPKQPQESIKRTLFDQGLQGATFGFADEVTDRIGAGIASAVTGQPYGDLLTEARQGTKDRQQRQFEQRPVASIGANLTGGLLTGGATAATKAGGAIGNTIRSGGLTARVGKAGLAGAASGGLYGAGTADAGRRLEGAQKGAVAGAVMGAALPVAGAGISKVTNKTPKVTSNQIKDAASQAYAKADDIGGVLKSDFTDKFVDSLDNLRPQTEAGRLLGGDDAFSQVITKMQAIKGKPITLQAAQEIDEFLGDAIDSQQTLGYLNKQGKKILDIQNSFRDMIEHADDTLVNGGKEGFEALKQGRKLWSQQIKLRDVERIIQRAEMTDNPATAIKTGFRTLYNNPKRLRGYSLDERKAIKKAAESGIISDTLKTFGSRLIPIAATVKGGPLGAVVTAGGAKLSRDGATKVQLNKANKIAELIAKNSGVQPKQDPKKLQAIIKALQGPQTLGVNSGVSGNITAQ